MTLVDTSVWIDHFRGAPASRGLAELLEAGEVVIHPFVRGEIALGHLGRRRAQVLRDLTLLPCVALVPDDDVLHMVEARRLAGSGIGWVDAHLLASALHAGGVLWTHDDRLSRVVSRLGIAG
jgi:predicted nucleic acid-binding protein